MTGCVDGAVAVVAPWLAATILTMTAVKTVCRATDNPQDHVWLIWTPNVVVVVLGLGILAYLSWAWTSPLRLSDLLRGRRG